VGKYAHSPRSHTEYCICTYLDSSPDAVRHILEFGCTRDVSLFGPRGSHVGCGITVGPLGVVLFHVQLRRISNLQVEEKFYLKKYLAHFTQGLNQLILGKFGIVVIREKIIFSLFTVRRNLLPNSNLDRVGLTSPGPESNFNSSQLQPPPLLLFISPTIQ